eukprot:CAMPEP_0117560796 /NCGR_PEP_ID=MMETSP0784-20121206/54063_1 /TAXON_ID=39447 /ORGANISM="" /LENGTH=42 /DNA_ID= /DNA_START= /DNA_END= /DNA_ORIENTATION=
MEFVATFGAFCATAVAAGAGRLAPPPAAGACQRPAPVLPKAA